MDILSLSPYVRVASDSVIHGSWILHERVIFDYELLFIKEGNVVITIEDKVYEGKPGNIFLFKPKKSHSIAMQTEIFHQPHLHFDLFYKEDSKDVYTSFKPLDKIPENERELFRNDEIANLFPDFIELRHPEHFEELLFELIRTFEEKAPFYFLETKAQLIELLVFLLRETSSDGREKARASEMKKVGDYIKTQTTKDVTLDELSLRFNISKYHLVRTFKSVYGMTPVHFHRMLRMEKAKERIQYSSLSLTEVARLTGYDSIHAFSRAFRLSIGVPPSYYRH
jgi:Transcriptional regulator containing an amidase domain and an AraC-type DNA-binding HTH domain